MFGEKYAGQNSEIYPGFHKVIPGKKIGLNVAVLTSIQQSSQNFCAHGPF